MTDITMLKHIPSNSAMSAKIKMPAVGLKLPKQSGPLARLSMVQLESLRKPLSLKEVKEITNANIRKEKQRVLVVKSITRRRNQN